MMERAKDLIYRAFVHLLWAFTVAVLAWHANDYYRNQKAEMTRFHAIEKRQREIFCEQAVKHGLLKRCRPESIRAEVM